MAELKSAPQPMRRKFTAPTKPRLTASMRRRLHLREELWPQIAKEDIWDRTKFTGFTTIPRTLSLILNVIDHLDKKTAGRVYFDLWCRAYDDYVVEIRDEYDAAFSSGYSGQRAIRSWRERIKVLEDIGFVMTHKLSHGAYRVILLLDPHKVIDRLRARQQVDDELYLTYKNLLVSIGAES